MRAPRGVSDTPLATAPSSVDSGYPSTTCASCAIPPPWHNWHNGLRLSTELLQVELHRSHNWHNGLAEA
jgi:hypothetical protein